MKRVLAVTAKVDLQQSTAVGQRARPTSTAAAARTPPTCRPTSTAAAAARHPPADEAVQRAADKWAGHRAEGSSRHEPAKHGPLRHGGGRGAGTKAGGTCRGEDVERGGKLRFEAAATARQPGYADDELAEHIFRVGDDRVAHAVKYVFSRRGRRDAVFTQDNNPAAV